MQLLRSIPFWFFFIALLLSTWAGLYSPTVWVIERSALDETEVTELTQERGQEAFVRPQDSDLWPQRGQKLEEPPERTQELIVLREEGINPRYFELAVRFHRGYWSLFPAFVTIVLCFLTREPVTALLGGILSGALLLRAYDITGEVMIPSLGTSSAALVVLLYLGFLGGLLGIWSRNGATLAFAEWVTRRFVKGPRTAKLAAWFLGVFFFQGGTISTLLVGTTIKPVADKEKVSHEELAYVVDSTASPIAILLPFNAWPFYVQGLIFVGGVTVLATEAARVQFFFTAIPLSFYALLAVFFTFLISIDRLPFLTKTFRAAIRRARETGELDRPGATPLQASEAQQVQVPEGYKPSLWEFIIPLFLILSIAIGTYLFLDSPNVLWAFGIALLVAFLVSRFRGLTLPQLMDGFTKGLQGVVYGAVILLLAVVIGGLSRDTGGGLFLVDLLGERMPYYLLPLILFLLTLLIAFATGTSWGTFAVTFPLAMPLAWAIGSHAELTYPILYLQICFATVLNGSVFGDQCSPISDTTVLSSLATGCDLMDHVRTQIYPCFVAGFIAVIGWTALTFYAA